MVRVGDEKVKNEDLLMGCNETMCTFSIAAFLKAKYNHFT